MRLLFNVADNRLNHTQADDRSGRRKSRPTACRGRRESISLRTALTVGVDGALQNRPVGGILIAHGLLGLQKTFERHGLDGDAVQVDCLRVVLERLIPRRVQ